MIPILLLLVAAYLIIASVAHSFSRESSSADKLSVAVVDGAISAICIAAALELIA